MMVPDNERWRLLATFNGGFTHQDGNNGSSVNGHTNEPLQDGLATAIGYRDGRIAIQTWTGGPNAGPGVIFARQSLPLIVTNGQLNPNSTTARSGASRSATRSASGAPVSGSTVAAT